MPYNQRVVELLDILKCVECDSSKLIIKQDNKSIWDGYTFQNERGRCLVCEKCNTIYPITDDDIPIMWTSQIKSILRGDKSNKVSDALNANIAHYNRISDNYSVNFRRDKSLEKKIISGAARLLPTLRNQNITAVDNTYHLDIGCGPGHVLGWIGDITKRKIGLDVSLANLRNARQSTGAYVVLGDATVMPFRDDSFILVTESSVLHHIFEWKKVIQEACRVCSKKNGGILVDSEPTFESLTLSMLARFVFEMRWPVYKILSFFDSKKIHFRDIKLAREYYQTAEIHNQPGRGFAVKEVEDVFRNADFNTEIFLSPNEHLQMRQTIPRNEAGWKRIILHLLSGHNPLLSKYGSFTVLARPLKDLLI